METKPLVTCHGDQSLFASLRDIITNELPRDNVEWKRSYGRPAKHIQLGGSFVPYDEDILPNEDDKNLINRPFFHIYWTECVDLESYKLTVKEEIQEWLADLKVRNIPDWMIVIVMNDDMKLKNKILPRSSVVDRIYSDFCSKQRNRCVVITNPLRSDVRTSESWYNFFNRLSVLLLQSYNRNLSKYEEHMRALREKRHEPKWSYIEYFLVQEELAFIYEMIGIYEESLLQYDEMDALFTEFLLQKNKSLPPWLKTIIQRSSSRSGLALNRYINYEIRDLIKSNTIGLLDFRNYFFSRQCALLFLMGQTNKVAERSLEFLHNTIQECRSLKVSMSRSVEQMWVFLSCWEVVQACERRSSTDSRHSFSVYTSCLWDCARIKLKELGEGFDLMPSSQPITIDSQNLLEQIVKFSNDDVEYSSAHPRVKLKNALSSKEAFRKLYLELTELAMGTYKHVGRNRAARMVGLDLAEFYMNSNEFDKAEVFLIDALKSFQDEGWLVLEEITRHKLAKCQRQLGISDRYVVTSCYLAGSVTLLKSINAIHFDSITEIAFDQKQKSRYTVPLNAIGSIENIVPKTSPPYHVDSFIEFVVQMKSSLSSPLKSCEIKVHVLKQADTLNNPSESLLCPGQLELKTSETQLPQIRQLPRLRQLPRCIPLQLYESEPPDSATKLIGFTCRDSHSLLRRCDSGVTVTDPCADRIFSDVFLGKDSDIVPGYNDLSVTAKVRNEGTYKPTHLTLSYGRLDFVDSIESISGCILQIIRIKPKADLTFSNREKLVAGTSTKCVLHLDLGSAKLVEGSYLKILPSPNFSIKHGGLLEDPEKIPISNSLSKCCGIPLEIICNMVDEISEFEMSVVCSCFDEKLQVPITVEPSLAVLHKLHTIKGRKMIQVTISGLKDYSFKISSMSFLSTECDKWTPVALHNPDIEYNVSNVLSANYVWGLPDIKEKMSRLDFKLTFQYRLCEDENVSGVCSRVISLNSHQTLYSVRTRILYDTEYPQIAQIFEIGCRCILEVRVKRVASFSVKSDEVFLLYDIKSDTGKWEILGKTKGVITLEDGVYSTRLPIIPLKSGNLRHPQVLLHKYRSDDDNGDDDEEEGIDASPDFTADQVYEESLFQCTYVAPKPDKPSADIAIVI